LRSGDLRTSGDVPLVVGLSARALSHRFTFGDPCTWRSAVFGVFTYHHLVICVPFGGLRTRTLVVYGPHSFSRCIAMSKPQTPNRCSRLIGKLLHFVVVLAMRIVACTAACVFHADITVINGGNDFNFTYLWEQLRSPAPPPVF
jgi:hypothetical protein